MRAATARAASSPGLPTAPTVPTLPTSKMTWSRDCDAIETLDARECYTETWRFPQSQNTKTPIFSAISKYTAQIRADRLTTNFRLTSLSPAYLDHSRRQRSIPRWQQCNYSWGNANSRPLENAIPIPCTQQEPEHDEEAGEQRLCCCQGKARQR